MTIKTKLTLGIIFLFILIVLFGLLSIFYINRLSNDSNVILKNNQESLIYCNNMLKASEDLETDPASIAVFEKNLIAQENNITEPGEQEASKSLRMAFEDIRKSGYRQSSLLQIRKSLYTIEALNQRSILRKNQIALNTAEDAKMWLTLIFSILVLIAFTFVVNFPSVIARPVQLLKEAIGEVSRKNYSKRIHLEQQDEFGELANTFNEMAEKLNEYEHSNLARIMFEKKRIETIINQMRDGIIGLDGNRNILFLNAIAEKMLGVKEADLVGRYVADIAIRNDLMRTLLQQNDNTALKIYSEGRESYFSKDMLDVKSGTETIGQVIVLRNITPFHELNEAKTNFIATVSHELKTPISAIKMSTRLLQDERVGSLNQEQLDLINSIEGDSNRLLKITSELLNMAQVETGQIQLFLQPTDANQVIITAIKATAVAAQQQQVTIQYDSVAGPEIIADAEKTTWVLVNFLANAIRFAPPGSVVEISRTIFPGHLRITVTDHGQGIEEQYQAKIFDRYFKVPGEQRSGTGLGLSICKEFIEAQQGTIGVTSHPGAGSSFFISLPLASPL